MVLKNRKMKKDMKELIESQKSVDSIVSELMEAKEMNYLAADGKSKSKDGYHDAGEFDEKKAKSLAKKYKGKAEKDPSGKWLVIIP